MSIGTFILCSVSFAAGVVAGVFLSEKGIVTSDTLGQGGRYVLDKTKSVIAQTRGPSQTAAEATI